MGLESMKSYSGSFLPQGGQGVICGEVFGLTLLNSTLEQALNNFNDKVLLQGMPVTINNAYTATDGTNVMNAGNPTSFSIPSTAPADAKTTDGFCVWGLNDFADTESLTMGYPRKGSLTAIAMFGSGLYVWLPANANLKNVRVGSPVYWDTVAGELKLSADTTANPPLPVKIKSSLVDGRKLIKDGDNIVFTETKAILVQL